MLESKRFKSELCGNSEAELIRKRGIMKSYKSKAVRRIKELAEKVDN
jgi:hypothetical protein